ncbi:MBL fold metallo-hydrolase [Mechercharimyces sp. CAU 1602]|uniref:MBL fold metallo-hydrolase n=1 Tax=Mechercharimyces sp. CAU 1602 TaxID=2973933 RepID=UPI0021613FB0|nr:MBL fold metallo-hydrolase [Mechercharimyces sp. CAU 1602]MCS1351906.1 MBL fold metallo-hydrolase [Mechercharimyces sp. CAU 1602]
MSDYIIRMDHRDDVVSMRCSYRSLGSYMNFCTYMVDGLMIDTGPPRGKKAVEEFVRQVTPKQIMITHHHEDHVGNASWLVKRFDVPLYMTKRTIDTIHAMDVIPYYRRTAWGSPQWITGEETTGEVVTPRYRFQILHTPGHCDDHHCLYEESTGWLFAGDLFLGTRLATGIRGESVIEMIASIEKILAYRITTVFCGHAGRVENGAEALKKKLDFLYWLVDETLALQKNGLSKAEMTSKLFKRNRMLEWFSLGDMSPVHLVDSIIKERAIS